MACTTAFFIAAIIGFFIAASICVHTTWYFATILIPGIWTAALKCLDQIRSVVYTKAVYCYTSAHYSIKKISCIMSTSLVRLRRHTRVVTQVLLYINKILSAVGIIYWIVMYYCTAIPYNLQTFMFRRVQNICIILVASIAWLVEHSKKQFQINQNPNTPIRGSGQAVSSCVVCLHSDSNTVFLPCGHASFCWVCARVLTQTPPGGLSTGTCPLCNHRIDTMHKIYL
jgi:hypothetical protein